MKSYTDLEQSKVLSKILPLESADMCWTNHCYGVMRSSMTISAKTVDEYKSLLDRFNNSTSIDVFHPAWSLAALFSMLPKSAYLEKGSSTELCRVTLPVELISSDWNLEPVDACVAMIEKLHEQKLL